MGKLVAAALSAVALVLSGCGDSGNDADEKSSSMSPEVNKYAHILDALAVIEGSEQDDDATFTPGAGPEKAAAEQNKALGWSAELDFRFAEVHATSGKSCIVSDDGYLVAPAQESSDGPLEYYLGDGEACSYDRADAKVIYRFVTITDDGRLKYRIVKGADAAPRTVKTARMY